MFQRQITSAGESQRQMRSAKTQPTVSAFGDGVVALCCTTALVGAAYFGFASCGGYVWHKSAYRIGAITLYAAALLLPSTLLARWRTKLAFAVGLPIAFALVESAVAPFYPGAPASLAQYGALFIQALEFGPCE